jgi:E-phenylitaconyl-CoA hydratase
VAPTLTRAAPLAQRATKGVAWRTAYTGWIEAVRFGEVMRKVAGATEDVAEGPGLGSRNASPNGHAR